jgi:nucleoside triphosphate pyrophosphatase
MDVKMRKDIEIILASGSPRRKQLLDQAGLQFKIINPSTDEHFPPGLPIEEIPVYIAENKAKAVPENHITTHSALIAADTIVVLHDQIIGKPADRAEAIKILSALSGNKHQVITGVVIIYQQQKIHFAEITEVDFRELTLQQIEYYIDHFQPYDKAGAYAIQEWIGLIGVEKINGCYFNVMGLPVGRVLDALQQL